MSNVLGRVDFAAKRKTVEVECPEFGGSIRLRALSLGELRNINTTDDDKIGSGIDQLALGIVDADGNRIYDSPEGRLNLAEMDFSLAKRLYDALNELHGVNADKTKNS